MVNIEISGRCQDVLLRASPLLIVTYLTPDIRVTGIDVSAFEPNPNCYLSINSFNGTFQTRPIRSAAPLTWPEPLRLYVAISLGAV